MLNQLTATIYVYHSSNDDQSNACLIQSGKNLLLVDTVFPVENFAQTVQQLGQPRLLFHSHCHMDHCQGDTAFPEAEIILFDRQPEMLRTESNRYPAANLRTQLAVFPCGSVKFGEIVVQVNPIGGHSFDSVAFYLPSEGVVIAGEAVANGRNGCLCVPHISSFGDPWQFHAGLEYIQSLDCQILIPAHGEVVRQTRIHEVIEDNLYYIERLLSCLEHEQSRSTSSSELIERCPALEDMLLHAQSRYLPIARAFHRKNWQYAATIANY